MSSLARPGFLIAGAFLALSILLSTAHAAPTQSFDQWLEGMAARALDAGISQHTIDSAFINLTLDPYVVKLDGKQPEHKLTLEEYLRNTISQSRIDTGRQLLSEQNALLAEISSIYQVQPQFILALWGMESNYGQMKGNFSVIQSLATLAYEGRRAELFEKQLLDALQILQTENIGSYDLMGSWAGAMGNCQFMPSSYLKYAVDFDKNGTADIWNSLPDTFASIANYLHTEGWDASQLAAEGSPNFEVLMHWNRSRYFGTAVNQLAGHIANAPGAL